MIFLLIPMINFYLGSKILKKKIRISLKKIISHKNKLLGDVCLLKLVKYVLIIKKEVEIMFFQHKKNLILVYLIFLFLLIYCALEVLAANSLSPEEVIKADIITQNNHDLSAYLSLQTTKVDSPENRNEIILLKEKYPEYGILQKSVNYNRQAAYNYANYYWDEVCNDGYYIAQNASGNTYAVPFPLGTSYTVIQDFFNNNTTYGQLYGADCAHFVSSCIGDNGGGGLPVPHNYSYAVYGYVSATGLADWILNNNYGLQKYSINDLEMGDVILYDVSGGGHHIVLYLGDGLIAAHSACLWGKTSVPLYGKSWIQPGLTVNKFIHITSNPPIITVTSPTNGTVWNVGETRSITWAVSGDTSHIDYFLLGYSIDGGTNYNLVNGVNSTAPGTARTYSWTVPNTPSTQCKILVGAIDANGNSLTGAVSGGLFTIQAIATRIISLSGDLNFGNVQVGTTSTKTLTISNTGNSTLTVTSISYPTGFSGSWSGTISAGGSNNVPVTFSPTQAITYSGNLTVNSNATSGTNTRSVSGTGVQSILLGDFGSANNGLPDCKVDFEDLMIFAMAYGATPADANWNPLCDIAGPSGSFIFDGVIDFEDLMIFAMHYGETCADL